MMSNARQQQMAKTEVRKKNDESQPAPSQDPQVLQAEQESVKLEQQKREQEESVQEKQAILAQNQAELDEQIDQIISADSELFLQQTTQPGGQ